MKIWGHVQLGIQILHKDFTEIQISPATSSDDWTIIYSESSICILLPHFIDFPSL